MSKYEKPIWNAYIRTWKKQHPGYMDRYRLASQAAKRLKQYGISQDLFDYLVKQQDGKCAICGDAPTGKKKTLCVDHDHSCCPGRISCGNCIRGLLCGNCNRGVGFLKDDPSVIESACVYLRRYKKRP